LIAAQQSGKGESLVVLETIPWTQPSGCCAYMPPGADWTIFSEIYTPASTYADDANEGARGSERVPTSRPGYGETRPHRTSSAGTGSGSSAGFGGTGPGSAGFGSAGTGSTAGAGFGNVKGLDSDTIPTAGATASLAIGAVFLGEAANVSAVKAGLVDLIGNRDARLVFPLMRLAVLLGISTSANSIGTGASSGSTFAGRREPGASGPDATISTPGVSYLGTAF
jgi:hypothetical protein